MIGVGFSWEEKAQKYIDLGCQMIEIGHLCQCFGGSIFWRKNFFLLWVDLLLVLLRLIVFTNKHDCPYFI